MTAIEVTLTLTLLLSLLIILVVSTRSYLRGSSTARCLAQQDRIAKQGVALMMNEIAQVDEVGTKVQRNTIMNAFLAQQNQLTPMANQLICPGSANLDENEINLALFGKGTEQEILDFYGQTSYQLKIDWYGNIASANSTATNVMQKYVFGYVINYNPTPNSSAIRECHGIFIPLGRTAFCFVQCTKAGYSRGLAFSTGDQLKYHVNKW